MPKTPPAIQAVDSAQGPWALHDVATSRSLEQAALQVCAPGHLMAAAGLSVARLALALHPHARHIRCWCGPGNNGGDGLVAARHLHQAGRTVDVVLLADTQRLPPDAARALQAAREAGVVIRSDIPDPAQQAHGNVENPDLHIDALLGIGSRRSVEGPMAEAIATLNRDAAPVLAVDLPSGLNGDTGVAIGPTVRAAATLALLTLKPGCHTGQGRDHAGQVWLDRLGLTPEAASASAWLSGAPHRPARLHDSHKGRYGDVWVVGGASGMVGAAWLAARAALRAGAGRVHVGLLDPQAHRFDPGRPELMVQRLHAIDGGGTGPAAWTEGLDRTTVVCGCGGGLAVVHVLPALLADAARLILDADALNAVATDAALALAVWNRCRAGKPTLLTPHPTEAARLLACSTAQVQSDRLSAARELAARLGATVVLKGSGSVIAAVGRTPWINPTGNAALATAGSGDVLAGWCAGRWAQQASADATAIAAAAAWIHGAAADQHQQQGRAGPLQAADLIDGMSRIPERWR